MKNITSNYKQNVKLFGRQIDSKITYELDGETVELGAEELNSITPIYESQILKSVMKQLDIDSNVEIPIGTILTYQFGVKVGNSYEYTNYGNYIVKTIEKQEDLRSWKITCYDKMLYAMTDYESVGVTYPITIRNYINAIATHLNLTFKNVNDVFANYDKEIQNELYLDENGGSLGYTFRDVLDELAQVTASTICINEEDDELEIRYINELVNETSTATGTNLNINNKYASSKIDLDLDGNTEQDGTPTPSNPVNVETVTGTQEISITGKNLLNNTATSQIINGITYTINSDGTVIANGTATSLSVLHLISNDTLTLSAGTYILSGCPDNGSNSTYRVDINNGANIRDYGSGATFTLTNSLTVNNVRIRIASGTTINNLIFKPMIRLSSITDDTYEPFKNNTYNINLGKNLLDLKDGTYTIGNEITGVVENGTITLNGTTSTNRFLTIDLNTNFNLENEEQYTISINNSVANSNVRFRIDDSGTYDTILNNINATKTITFSSSSVMYNKQIKIRIASGTTLTDYKIKPMIEKGSVATSYSAYKTPIELCKIGDYQDYIYKSNNTWYKYKAIGKVVLDGSEDDNSFYIFSGVSSGNSIYISTNLVDNLVKNETALSNYFIYKNVYAVDSDEGFYISNSTPKLRFRINKTKASTISEFKTWLSTHNTTVYYVLETPVSIEITDLDLIEQLNAVRLMAGINNISVSSSNLASPLKLTYATNCEEIDEEYLKDINVNFGEKFGPVNSIVLSRASESDNVYLRNEISVENDGLCEIKIKDNQIMNFNDRSNYLPDILDKLYGLEYYINDFNSTGITYLDLCDKYYAKVFDNRYPCIMFNDEVDITQGLQETIHTKMPEESETDYKKADKTDRRINQAYIIVNKQEQTIEALTSSVETISQTENNNYLELLNKFQSLDENIADITEIENAVRQLQTNTYTKTEIQEIANGTAQDGTKVSAVITTSGTFDKDGLTIEQTTADTKTNINADGMIIYNKTGSTDDALLTVNSNGVITKNLKVETYTEIGKNSRFEDFVTDDYEDATAVFWIGS